MRGSGTENTRCCSTTWRRRAGKELYLPVVARSGSAAPVRSAPDRSFMDGSPVPHIESPVTVVQQPCKRLPVECPVMVAVANPAVVRE